MPCNPITVYNNAENGAFAIKKSAICENSFKIAWFTSRKLQNIKIPSWC